MHVRDESSAAAIEMVLCRCDTMLYNYSATSPELWILIRQFMME